MFYGASTFGLVGRPRGGWPLETADEAVFQELVRGTAQEFWQPSYRRHIGAQHRRTRVLVEMQVASTRFDGSASFRSLRSQESVMISV